MDLLHFSNLNQVGSQGVLLLHLSEIPWIADPVSHQLPAFHHQISSQANTFQISTCGWSRAPKFRGQNPMVISCTHNDLLVMYGDSMVI